MPGHDALDNLNKGFRTNLGGEFVRVGSGAPVDGASGTTGIISGGLYLRSDTSSAATKLYCNVGTPSVPDWHKVDLTDI
tara:strand:- start:254 stop:490 length:237 start_codon:yes stop_codon:yes gene_type:complete